MAKENKNLEELMQKLDENPVQIEDVSVMFLDISSSKVGYAVASLNFKTKNYFIKKSGVIWLHEKWPHGKKYNYIANSILNHFWILGDIDYVVVEQYSVNPNKMMGVNVVSEMQGAIKSALWEHELDSVSILPQTWRSQLGIKPTVTINKNGKKEKDFKTPTKERILQDFDVPENVLSNISKKPRKTPDDVYDAMGICMGWMKKYNISMKKNKNIEYNPHVVVDI